MSKLSLEDLLRIEKKLNEREFLGVPFGSLTIDSLYSDYFLFKKKDSIVKSLRDLLSILKFIINPAFSFCKFSRHSEKIDFLFNVMSNQDKSLDFFRPLYPLMKIAGKNVAYASKPNFVIEDGGYPFIHARLNFLEHLLLKFKISSFILNNFFYIGNILKSSNVGNRGIIRFYTFFISQAITLYFFDNFFKKNKISCILTDNERNKFNSALVLAGKKNHVSTVSLIHGSTYPPAHYYPTLSDFLVCWGEKHVSQFKDLGLDEEKLFIGGNTKIRKIKQKDKINLKNKLGLLNSYVITLGTTNFSESERVIFLEKFLVAVNAIKNVDIIIKLHPNDSLDLYKEYLNNQFVKFFTSDQLSGNEALTISDVIVSYNSQYLMDAFLTGLSVVVFNLNEVTFPLGIGELLVGEGISPDIKSPSDLRMHLEKLIMNYENKQDSFVDIRSSFCKYVDTESAEVIFRKLIQIEKK